MNLLRDTNHSVEQLVLLRFIVVKSVKRRSKSMKLPSFVINIKLESLYELFVQSLHSFLIQSPTETQFTIDSSFLMSFQSLKNSTAPTNNCVHISSLIKCSFKTPTNNSNIILTKLKGQSLSNKSVNCLPNHFIIFSFSHQQRHNLCAINSSSSMSSYSLKSSTALSKNFILISPIIKYSFMTPINNSNIMLSSLKKAYPIRLVIVKFISPISLFTPPL